MKKIYQPVIHDGPREMERQLWLLAKAGADVWKAWWDAQKHPVDPNDPMVFKMRELMKQLSETDIFMGGFHTRIEQ